MKNRILVTSIPSWNSKTGSDTFSSLFSSFNSKDISNIYISGGIPDSTSCSRYFHISENCVVKSVFNRRVQTGQEVVSNFNDNSINTSDSFKIKVKRLRIFLWARELAWLLGNWKSNELNIFLDDIHPDVLVFPIENYPYFNRLNQYIITRCKPKRVVGYLWDDNFTYKQHPYNFIFKIERYFRRRQIRKLIAYCTDVLAISPKMKEECDKEFGVNSIVLTKPIFNISNFQVPKVGSPIRMLYTGKLIIGRDLTLVKVASAIREINRYGQKIILDVYTQTVLSDKIRQRIDIPGCCVLHAPIPQTEVIRLQKESDVLLFVESLSNRDLTARLSFSTKLTDYFAAGKCVWGVGNSDLGPINYIKTENAGFVSTNDNEIKEVLKEIIRNPAIICEKARLGYECGIRNHNKDKIIKILKEVVFDFN